MNLSEGQLIKMIRQVVREEFASSAMAEVVQNASSTRSTFQKSATDSQFANARNIQPYGFASRAPVKTPCLVLPIGGNPSNVNIIGYHDDQRPPLDDGETMLYNEFGQDIYLKNGSIHIGSPTAEHPVSLGDTVQSIFSQFLELYIQNTPEGNLGYPIGPPSNEADATTLKASPVDDGTMNSEIVFTE